MYIHPVNFRSKQSSLISARTGTDFHDNIFVIVGVLGQKQNFHFLLQFFHPLLAVIQGFLYHFPHFFIIFLFQHRQRVLDVLLTFLIFRISLHNGSQIALLLHQLPETFLIVRYRRLMQLAHNFFKANQ